ncbi:MAG: S-layer homology domain-containing protein [Tissierellia bacterium]|nr:S-layer homology domain-containing protein [Tissierellia bacterium]
MNKRILTLVLALVMVFGLAATAFAAPEVEKITNPKVQWLIDKNIVEGRLQDDGKTKVFDLDKTITREEVAKLVILYKGSENLARSLKGTKGIFSDVAIDRWSNGYINTAALDNLIIGYPDKTFKPEGEITYAEVAAILVRMNKKWTAADEKAAVWPSSFMKAAEQFGILKDVKIEDANAKAIRERVFEMMYNAFDGTYQAPIVNDKLGVVSRVWVDGIQLNGKDEFKVTRDTVFVGSDLNNLYKADDFYGALVRIALNKDNEITHIVILGNNGIAQPIARWNGIAEKGVIKDTAPAANLSNASNDEIEFDMADGILTVTDKTRIFVADKGTKNFYEAKKVGDAIDFKEEEHFEDVYAAYDVQAVTGVKYARVIVFAHGKELKANKDLVRITNNVNSSYKFMAENTKAVEKEYDISKYDKNFPANYGFEKMDVVKLTREGENGVSKVEKRIDYSEDNVYEVTAISDIRYNSDGTASFSGNKIELKDKNGSTKEFALSLDGVSVFTNGLGKGAHVQIAFEDTEKLVIDVISKVDIALRGWFEDGKPANYKCGFLTGINFTKHDGLLLTIKHEGVKDVYKPLTPDFLAPLTERFFDGCQGEKAFIEYLYERYSLAFTPGEEEDMGRYQLIVKIIEEAITQNILEEQGIEVCYQEKANNHDAYIHIVHELKLSDAFAEKVQKIILDEYKAWAEEECAKAKAEFAPYVKYLPSTGITWPSGVTNEQATNPENIKEEIVKFFNAKAAVDPEAPELTEDMIELTKLDDGGHWTYSIKGPELDECTTCEPLAVIDTFNITINTDTTLIIEIN